MGMESVKYIKLSNSADLAIVDAEDYECLAVHKWRVLRSNLNCYVIRDKKKKDDVSMPMTIRMHREILSRTTKIPENRVIDHINHNGFDNRKVNLRICTYSENNWNRSCLGNKYKGVYFDPRNKKNPWRSRITVNGKKISLGVYDVAEKAALAYNVGAKTHYGEYACLNYIAKPAEDGAILYQAELELT